MDYIKIKDIKAAGNARFRIEKEDLSELMVSIKQHGMLQPIVLQKNDDGGYIVVAGNRRLEAAKKLGWESIPASTIDVETEKEAFILHLTENITRKNLSPIEEGVAFDEAQRRFNMTPSELAAKFGKAPSYIVGMMTTAKKKIPAHFRKKIVSFTSGDRTKKNGLIPATAATTIVNLAQTHSLTNEQRDKLFEMANRDHVIGIHLTRAAQLMSLGYDPEEAYEKAIEVKYYTLRIPMRAKVYENLRRQKVNVNKEMLHVLAEDKRFGVYKRHQALN